jgi:hypothetical protein
MSLVNGYGGEPSARLRLSMDRVKIRIPSMSFGPSPML